MFHCFSIYCLLWPISEIYTKFRTLACAYFCNFSCDSIFSGQSHPVDARNARGHFFSLLHWFQLTRCRPQASSEPLTSHLGWFPFAPFFILTIDYHIDWFCVGSGQTASIWGFPVWYWGHLGAHTWVILKKEGVYTPVGHTFDQELEDNSFAFFLSPELSWVAMVTMASPWYPRLTLSLPHSHFSALFLLGNALPNKVVLHFWFRLLFIEEPKKDIPAMCSLPCLWTWAVPSFPRLPTMQLRLPSLVILPVALVSVSLESS